MLMRTLLPSLTLFLTLCLTAGCASSGGQWGENAFRLPSAEQFKTATRNALVDKKTWVPIVGAAVFSIDDYDQQVSDWATEHNPIYGSIDNAQQASDDLQDLAKLSFWVSAMVADTGEKNPHYNRFQGITMGHAAIALTHATTSSLKSITGRTRPNGSSKHSFPSGHTSNATVHATLAFNNLNYSQLSEGQKAFWQWSNYSIAALTGWARIEAEKHYPSDVLFGFALGNFIGSVFNQLYLTPESTEQSYVQLSYARTDGIQILFGFQW